MKWLPQQPLTVKGDPASKAFMEYLQNLGGPSAPSWGDISGTLADQLDLQAALDAKQDDLVSGTNIKTVNGNSLLGAGDVVIGGGADHLGTLTTTSGSSQSLTSLDLTPYKFLRCTFTGVSFAGTNVLQIAGVTCSPSVGGAVLLYGSLLLDLANGVFASTCVATTGGDNFGNVTTYTTATTTVTFSTPGAFDAGSIRVYGVR